VALILVAVGVDHRDLDAVDEKAIPCLRTLLAFFAGSQVNRIPDLYGMYLRMSRCEVLPRGSSIRAMRSQGGSFDRMIVPEPANMPPAPVADRDLGIRGARWSYAAHLAHALLQCVHAVYAGMHVGEAAAIGVQRQFAAGAVLRSAIVPSGRFLDATHDDDQQLVKPPLVLFSTWAIFGSQGSLRGIGCKVTLFALFTAIQE
jgi:hypothetical protein